MMNLASSDDGISPSPDDDTSLVTSKLLPRQLNEEEKERLEKQVPASEFKRRKLKNEMRKNWDKFYLRNKDNFFKDRWWTQHEFEELLRPHINLQDNLNYLEIGCGVGNLLFPLKQQYPHWNFYAFDFSDNAIRLLQERCAASGLSIKVAVADLTEESFTLNFPAVDIATLVFVLSAIPPEKQRIAVRNLLKLVKIGGIVTIRDYGINDYAMVRFGRECKLAERFYARQDGTMAYYFELDELDNLFMSEGFCKETSTYLLRKTTNHLKGISVDRVFVQGAFVRSR